MIPSRGYFGSRERLEAELYRKPRAGQKARVETQRSGSHGSQQFWSNNLRCPASSPKGRKSKKAGERSDPKRTISRSKERAGADRSKPRSLQATIPLHTHSGTANGDDEREVLSASKNWNILTLQGQSSQDRLGCSPPYTPALDSLDPCRTVNPDERSRNRGRDGSLLESVNENAALQTFDGRDRKKMGLGDGRVGEKAVSTRRLTEENPLSTTGQQMEARSELGLRVANARDLDNGDL